MTLPIDKLIRVTHVTQAVNIECQNEDDQTNFVFEANPKCGKAYATSDESGKYRCVGEDSFIKIKSSEKFMNGKLSWWSPEIVSCYNSDGSDDYRKSVWEATKNLKSE